MSIASVVVSDLSLWLMVLFGSCCSNVVSLERYLLTNDSTYLLTFVQFVAVTLQSGVDLAGGFTGFQIPLRSQAVNVFLFFTTSILNNLVFKYHITVAVHIVVRSLATFINMCCGYLWFGKRYGRWKILSNVVLVAGVCTVTLSRAGIFADWGGGVSEAETGDGGALGAVETAATAADMEMAIGVTLLVVSMVFGSLLGLYTETLYARHGRYWQETLFLTHAMSLPMFLLGYRQLRTELAGMWPISTATWQLVAANCVSQIVCVKSVNRLASRMSSLSLNIVLLLRRFTSLVISVLFITRDGFTPLESAGCLLVFIGALSYSFSN